MANYESPLESVFTWEVSLELFVQELPATAGEPLAAMCLLGVAACSGWRSLMRGPDFEDERNVRGHDQ